MKIGIIIGSIRDGRAGQSVADRVATQVEGNTDAEFAVLDLRSFDVPLLTSATIPGAANKRYDDPRVTAWSQAVDACDGFIFVTPEYNHSVPGGFKNAFDSLGMEWGGKTVAFVSYGAEAGVRAVEHWRQIVSNFSMVDVRQQVSVSLFTEFGPDGFAPNERRAAEFQTLLGQLIPLTAKLRG